jgi:hypothetical protein
MRSSSRKQRQQGRRSRSRRSLKGGVPKAYNYEGDDLIVGNPLIQIAVTKEDDGTYSFNVPGETPFNNYCEIVKYYESKSSLACVKPSFVSSSGSPIVVPSLVQILGLALLLYNEKVRLEQAQLTLNLTENVKPCMDALTAVANNPKRSLVDAASGNCMVADGFTTVAKYTQKDRDNVVTKVDALRNYAFYMVSKLIEDDVKEILKYFKIAMFYYKFNSLPTQHLDTLTFADFFSTSPDAPNTTNSMRTFVVDTETFNKNVAADSYKKYKVVFYTPANLASAASVAPSASSAAPVASVASVASVAPSPSSSVDARLTALETAVAAIQAKLAS